MTKSFKIANSYSVFLTKEGTVDILWLDASFLSMTKTDASFFSMTKSFKIANSYFVFLTKEGTVDILWLDASLLSMTKSFSMSMLNIETIVQECDATDA